MSWCLWGEFSENYFFFLGDKARQLFKKKNKRRRTWNSFVWSSARNANRASLVRSCASGQRSETSAEKKDIEKKETTHGRRRSRTLGRGKLNRRLRRTIKIRDLRVLLTHEVASTGGSLRSISAILLTSFFPCILKILHKV